MFADPAVWVAVFNDPTFWVAVSFFGFIVLIFYFKVPGMIATALDSRADAIRSELEEARRLREEAQAILADYQRKQREAEQNAEEIVAQARKEAQSYAEETRKALKEMLEQRTKLAEEKIENAEAQAMDEVRNRAVDVAIEAADKVIGKTLSQEKATDLVEQVIRDLPHKLN